MGPECPTMQNYRNVHAPRHEVMNVGDNHEGARALMRLRPGVDVGAAVRAAIAVIGAYNATLDVKDRVEPEFAWGLRAIQRGQGAAQDIVRADCRGRLARLSCAEL